MNHTKQSAKFRTTLAQVIKGLEDLQAVQDSSDDHELLNQAILLLRENTTDSPCMIAANGDEPVFVLRGQDLFADKRVDDWCEDVMGTVLFNENQKLKDKVYHARHCARAMRVYGNRKYPD